MSMPARNTQLINLDSACGKVAMELTGPDKQQEGTMDKLH